MSKSFMNKESPLSSTLKIWYLAPGGIPVEETDKRAATATMFVFEGDAAWRPIHELVGYRKPEAVPERKPAKGKKSSTGKFPNPGY